MAEVEARYLIFMLQGRRHALDLAQVAEVCEPPLLYPIPRSPACYPGAANFHGTIVAVLDLALFLGLPSCHDLTKLIVLDRGVAALGLLVERVVRIVPASQAELLPPPEEPFAVGVLGLPEGEALVLDGAAIAQRAAEHIGEGC